MEEPVAEQPAKANKGSDDDSSDDEPLIEDDQPATSAIANEKDETLESVNTESSAVEQGDYKKREEFIHSIKEGAAEEAIEACVAGCLEENERKKLVAAFLLDSVNHFNLVQERVLIVTRDTLFRAQYSFGKKKMTKKTAIPFSQIKRVQRGKFVVTKPKVSGEWVATLNNQPGIRVFTNLDPPSRTQRWNPSSKTIPYSTYGTHSPTREHAVVTDQHSVEVMYDKLREAVIAYDELMETTKEDKFVDDDIVLQTGVGIGNMMYNKFDIGRDLDRKGMLKEDQRKVSDATKQAATKLKQKANRKESTTS